MKTNEELNALKEEVETLNKKLAELSDEELTQISGGQNEFLNWITRSRANTYQYLFGDFNSVITDIQNQRELFSEFMDKMTDIRNTTPIIYPDDLYAFFFCVYKDDSNRVFPYVYVPGTFSVIRWIY